MTKWPEIGSKLTLREKIISAITAIRLW
jgi:hypothetical protein